MTAPLLVDQVAIRLADEGVPLRAIARAINTPSANLRETLHGAVDDGQLLELPQEDWPAGFPRDQRALQLSRMVSEKPQAVAQAVQRLFSMPPTEVTMLMAMLQNDSISRERIDMARKTVDVHICNIRQRLAPFNVRVETIWGYGYQVPTDDRKRVMDIIFAHTGGQDDNDNNNPVFSTTTHIDGA